MSDRRDIGLLVNSTGGTAQADDDISGSTADDIATILAKINSLIEVVQKKVK
jgi:hypothetical protein